MTEEEQRQRIAELEKWQLEVAEHMGLVNRAEGQDGYEVAPASIVKREFDDVNEALANASADAFLEAEAENGELALKVIRQQARIEELEREVKTLNRVANGDTHPWRDLCDCGQRKTDSGGCYVCGCSMCGRLDQQGWGESASGEKCLECREDE
jgi:hypothetical protein